MIFSVIAHIIAAYFMGGITPSILLSRAYEWSDPRTQGSGSTGATNAYRVYGPRFALLTLLGDIGKTWLALLPLHYYAAPAWAIVPIGLAIFIGHCYPIYHQFQGGKGVAVSATLLLCMSVPIALFAFLVWVVTFLLCARASVSSLTAALLSTIVSISFLSPQEWMLLLLLTLSMCYTHRENLKRLLSGREDRLFH
jgi:glycerol-3-phosphate acyltransferase PlsY